MVPFYPPWNGDVVPTPKPTNPMTRKFVTVGACFASAVFALAVAPRMLGQAAAPAPAPAPGTAAESTEETVKLSPFVVSAEEDTGYQATATLAGTRVRTDLKDVASSISVVTEQFLRDTNVRNAQELLIYTPNTEVTGLHGNFSGQAGPQYQESLINPNNNTRVRGLDAADNTRDYFLTDIPWDSFNVGRVDLQRGPNSILFGVGSPAGIINNSVNDATFKNAYQFENRLGDNGSMRNSIDLNQMLLRNELAIRVAGVVDRQNYEQKPAYNNTTRYYAAVRYAPRLFGEGNHTEIRAKYEHGQVRSNNPRIIPPVDEITPWFQSGTDAYGNAGINKTTINQYVVGMASNSALANQYFNRGGFAQGRTYWPDVLSYFNGVDSNGVVPALVSALPTKVISGMINGGYGISSTGAIDNNIGGLPNYRPSGIPDFQLWATNAPVSIPGGAYYADRVITDTSIFDFYHSMLDGDNKREWQNWNALNVALSQTFFNDRVGLEAVFDHQDYNNGQDPFLQGVNHAISIDVNQVFSDGSMNLNAGRPYVASSSTAGASSSNHIIRDSIRFTAVAELRAEDFLGKDSRLAKILGRHVFTGLWATDQRRSKSVNWVKWAADPGWAAFSAPLPGSLATKTVNRQFDWVDYIGPNLMGNPSAANSHLSRIMNIIQPSSTTAVTAFNSHWNRPNGTPGTYVGGVYVPPPASANNPVGYVDPSAPYTYLNSDTGALTNSTESENPANYVGWQTTTVNWLSADNPAQFPDLVTGSQKLRFKDISKGFTWQGYMLDDNYLGQLVPVFGWRRDQVTNYATAAPIDPVTQFVPLSYEDDPTTRRVATGESKSWGGVYHLPKFLTSKLPGGTTLSIFYNRSRNFKADAPRTNLRGDTIANPDGQTKEYGFTVTTLDDRLSLKVDWYKTKVSNATFNVTNGNSIAGLGGNGYWMWAAPAWGYFWAAQLQDGLEGRTPNNNYFNWAANDNPGVYTNTNADLTNAAWLADPATVRGRATVQAWLALPVPPAFFDYYAIHPIQIHPANANGELRNALSGGGFDPSPTGTFSTFFQPGSEQPTVPNVVSTVDTLSQGQEFELVARPTKNWNVIVNYTRTKATKQNIDAATVAFMNGLHDFFTGPGGDLREWGAGGSRIGPDWVTNVWNPYLVSFNAQGQSAPEVAPWRLNAITSYNFDHGIAKGAFIGGAVRMEAGKILGYRYSATLGTLDVTQVLKGSTDTHFDAWIGYTRKLGTNLNWRIQVNLQNVLQKNKLVPSRLQPDGTFALERIQEGMTWTLSNTFDF